MKPTHIEILAGNGTTHVIPKKDIRLSLDKKGEYARVDYGFLEREYFAISKETYEKVRYELLKEI